MRRAVRIMLIALFILIVAALLALAAYGRFAERAMGAPSQALPVHADAVRLDRDIAPLLARHEGHSGLALLGENADAYAARALSARLAERSLDVQYYLWHDDLTGRLLAWELLQAAERGVRVRLLVDDINAHGADLGFRSLAQHPNIEVRLFNPSRNRGGTFGRALEMLLRAASLNRRMHNKAWIADGRFAVVGGRNLGDEYFDAARQTNFLDADVAMVGPVVAQTADIFDAFWNSRAVLPIEALAREQAVPLARVREALAAEAQGDAALPYLAHVAGAPGVRALLQGEARWHWTADAQVVSDPPEKAFGGGETDWLIAHIAEQAVHAEREFTLISPYFVPGAQGTRMLNEAVSRDVAVSVLTNSLASNDVLAVHSGYVRYRKALVEGGVALRELMPFGDPDTSLFGSSGASLHTKAYVVDGESGFVGSFNFDPRSVRLNTEMGVSFRSPALAQEVLALHQAYAAPDKSYAVRVEDGRVVWLDERADPPAQLRREPEAAWWQRAAVAVLRWLPLESQL